MKTLRNICVAWIEGTLRLRSTLMKACISRIVHAVAHRLKLIIGVPCVLQGHIFRKTLCWLDGWSLRARWARRQRPGAGIIGNFFHYNMHLWGHL